MCPRQYWGQIGLLLAVITVTQATCPGSPWQEWRGHCYRLTYQSVPWHGVRGDCKAFFRSADAASINSEAENDFIQNLAEQQTVWLGMRSANDMPSWVDGARVTYRNFPGRRTRTQAAQDVVQLDGRTGRWQFAVSHTAAAQRGVCKMPSCQCPSGWTEWGRRCYKAVRQPLTWLEASQRCRRMAPTADLVSIINERENNFVHGLLQQYPFWIGLNDIEEEGKYLWSSGEKYPYTNWHPPTEPNGHNHVADCVDMLQDKTWSDTKCGADGRRNPFVCEQIICGRDKQIRPEPVRGRSFRVWRPDDELRCPEGWSRSGDNCYSKPTVADTFSRVQSLCASQHPQANIALISSLEENDRAFYTADTLPIWVDYGSRSGRALNSRSDRIAEPFSTFTYWEPDVTLARSVDSDCAAIQKSSQWRPQRCQQDQLPGLCQLPACNPECPPGWIPFEGHCYRTVRPRKTLAEAAAVCQRDGGHLASIQSQDENDFVTTLAFRSSGVNYSQDKTARFVWIGASRADRTSDWAWTDCADWALSRWHRGDGDDPSLTTGTCAALFFSGRWRDDVDCKAGKLSSVCELDPCREQFGPADRSGCRSGKVTQVTPAPPPKATQATPAPTPKATEGTRSPAPAPMEKFVCPPDWTELDGYCYRGVIEQKTFVEALQMCTVTFSPAHVASAHTPQQNQLLLELTGGGPAWLGLTAAYDFPEWRWMDGSDAEGFTAWARRQPDSSVANMKVCSVVNRRGRWATRSCVRGQNSFVCRLPAVRLVANSSCPDPTSWREEAGSCYAFNREGASYGAARRTCGSLATPGFRVHLPVIADAQEEAALQRLTNGHVMRLGLVRSRSGQWLWEDGTVPSFTNWLSEPPPPDQGVLCAVMDGRRGGWTTQSCDNLVPFYCEATPASEEDYDYDEEYADDDYY